MKKQGNIYTIIYIIVLVVVVGAALAITSMALKDKQEFNANADKMKQILASVHVVPADDDAIKSDFEKYVVSEIVVNSSGETIGDDAFGIDIAAQSKIADETKRQLPVFVCDMGADGIKYVLPVYGTGLWGPLWGYVAVDANGSTIYGAFFAHQGETPGLGAEIEKPYFSKEFEGKNLFKDNQFLPVAVVKKGMKPTGDEDYVDGISGGTITSKGVSSMLANCLTPYREFLKTIGKQE